VTTWRIWSDPGAYAVTLTGERAEGWWDKAMRGTYKLVSGDFGGGEFVLLAGRRRDQLIKLSWADRPDVPPEGPFQPGEIEAHRWAINQLAVSRETAWEDVT
jgi:hypothetical protein